VDNYDQYAIDNISEMGGWLIYLLNGVDWQCLGDFFWSKVMDKNHNLTSPTSFSFFPAAWSYPLLSCQDDFKVTSEALRLTWAFRRVRRAAGNTINGLP